MLLTQRGTVKEILKTLENGTSIIIYDQEADGVLYEGVLGEDDGWKVHGDCEVGAVNTAADYDDYDCDYVELVTGMIKESDTDWSKVGKSLDGWLD